MSRKWKYKYSKYKIGNIYNYKLKSGNIIDVTNIYRNLQIFVQPLRSAKRLGGRGARGRGNYSHLTITSQGLRGSHRRGGRGRVWSTYPMLTLSGSIYGVGLYRVDLGTYWGFENFGLIFKVNFSLILPIQSTISLQSSQLSLPIALRFHH